MKKSYLTRDDFRRIESFIASSNVSHEHMTKLHMDSENFYKPDRDVWYKVIQDHRDKIISLLEYLEERTEKEGK